MSHVYHSCVPPGFITCWEGAEPVRCPGGNKKCISPWSVAVRLGRQDTATQITREQWSWKSSSSGDREVAPAPAPPHRSVALGQRFTSVTFSTFPKSGFLGGLHVLVCVKALYTLQGAAQVFGIADCYSKVAVPCRGATFQNVTGQG